MWNDCIIVDNSSPGLKYSNYVKHLGRSPKYHVWLDTIDNVCFGLDRDFIDYYYIKKSFTTLAHKHMNKLPSSKKVIIKHSQVFYKDIQGINSFKNKSMLLIGGGPTTNKVNWDNINTDVIWSCNHFFQHPKCIKKNIDLFILGAEVDLSYNNELLHDYMKSHRSIIVFEDIKNKYINFDNLYPNKCTYMYSNYRSKIGTAPRLIMLAIALGINEIYFVGMDGLKKDGSAKHAFEPKKEPRGTRGYGLFRRQYVEFWDYILNYIKPDIKFHNLGEGYEENLTTNISQQCFPLNLEI